MSQAASHSASGETIECVIILSCVTLQASLRYMVYGKQGIFDADRLIDLLNAFESFTVASQSSRGNMDQQQLQQQRAAVSSNGNGSCS